MTHDVRSMRKARDWSQEKLADYLGIDRSTVSRIECGREPTGPVRKLLDQLADSDPAPDSARAAE